MSPSGTGGSQSTTCTGPGMKRMTVTVKPVV